MFEGVWGESCGRLMRYEDWSEVSRQSGCKKYDMRSVWSIAGFESGWTKNVPRCTKSTKCTRFGTWMFRILELISGILWIEFLSLDDGFFFGSLEFEKWYVEKISPNFKYLRIFFVSKISTSPGNWPQIYHLKGGYANHYTSEVRYIQGMKKSRGDVVDLLQWIDRSSSGSFS